MVGGVRTDRRFKFYKWSTGCLDEDSSVSSSTTISSTPPLYVL